jgi:hypothetical protein
MTSPLPQPLLECPLCSVQFSCGEEVCKTCPMNAGCDIVRCPGCGYSFPRTSKIVEWVRRLALRFREDRP